MFCIVLSCKNKKLRNRVKKELSNNYIHKICTILIYIYVTFVQQNQELFYISISFLAKCLDLASSKVFFLLVVIEFIYAVLKESDSNFISYSLM